MAKKSPKPRPSSGGKMFSMVGLHNKLDETLARLKSEKKTKKRDQLIGLVQGLRGWHALPAADAHRPGDLNARA